jgi:hypothetical protein
MVTTAVEICDALDGRYCQRQNDRKQESWIAIREARSGASFAGNTRQCDYLAINTWQGRGMQVVGHEIKVSKADWQKELDNPDKAEMFARYCRRWWVVMPSVLAIKVRDEVPPAWGLISVSELGRCTELQSAPAREPEQIPAWWWIGWMAQLDRRDKRERSAAQLKELHDNVQAEVDRRMAQYQREHGGEVFTRQDVLDLGNLREWRAVWDALVAITGVTDLHRAGDWDVERFARLWKMRYNVDALTRLRTAMTATTKVLDELETA